VVAEELDVGTIDLDTAFLSQLDVLVTAQRSEAPVLGHDDLLASWELVLRAAKSFDGCGTVFTTKLASAHHL